LHVYRFVKHELMIEKELGTIEWKARISIQQKEAAQEQGEAGAAAGSRQTASMAEHVQTEEKDKDIRLLENGGEESSAPETKTGKHEYTHHLR
jgi:hypothetical protein